MSWSACNFIKSFAEFQPMETISGIPHNTRGIYVLLEKGSEDVYNVVYIGLAAGYRAGIRSRMRAHRDDENKKGKWTHFSYFEVHDNITENEIRELEGLFRHIFRKNTVALKLNTQLRYKKFKQIQKINLKRRRGKRRRSHE